MELVLHKSRHVKTLAVLSAFTATLAVAFPAHSEDSIVTTLAPAPPVVSSWEIPNTVHLNPTANRSPAAPKVQAGSAILVDPFTGQTLFALNPDVRRPHASTTKIMTALLVLEHGNLQHRVKAHAGVEKIPTSSLHLKAGEELSLEDLLYAVMIRSANDAAVVVARHVGGTEKGFVDMMNARAQALGMFNTSFKNPNGLHAQGHYSTAYDLSLLAREAIKNDLFNQIASTRSRTVDRPDSPDKLLLARHRYLKNYQWADGIKSGYTRQARYCYVGSATRDGQRLISVALRSEDSGGDTIAMMEYGFNNFKKHDLAEPGAPVVAFTDSSAAPGEFTASPSAPLSVWTAPNAKQVTLRTEVPALSYPVRQGERIGSLVAFIDGKPAVRVALLADQDIQHQPPAQLGLGSAWMYAALLGILLTIPRVRQVAGITYGSRRTSLSFVRSRPGLLQTILHRGQRHR